MDTSHQAEAIRKRIEENKVRIDEHASVLKTRDNESELIKKLSEINKQNEMTLMKELLAQFD